MSMSNIPKFSGVKMQSSSKAGQGAEVKAQRPSDSKLSKMIGELMIDGDQNIPLHPQALQNYSVAEWKADVSVRKQAIADKEGNRSGISNKFSHAVQRIKNFVTTGTFKTDKQLLENSTERLVNMGKVLSPELLNKGSTEALEAEEKNAVMSIKEADKEEAKEMVSELLKGKNPSDGVTKEMMKFRAQHKDNPVIALALLEYASQGNGLKGEKVQSKEGADFKNWMPFASEFPSSIVLRNKDFILNSLDFFKREIKHNGSEPAFGHGGDITIKSLREHMPRFKLTDDHCLDNDFMNKYLEKGGNLESIPKRFLNDMDFIKEYLIREDNINALQIYELAGPKVKNQPEVLVPYLKSKCESFIEDLNNTEILEANDALKLLMKDIEFFTEKLFLLNPVPDDIINSFKDNEHLLTISPNLFQFIAKDGVQLTEVQEKALGNVIKNDSGWIPILEKNTSLTHAQLLAYGLESGADLDANQIKELASLYPASEVLKKFAFRPEILSLEFLMKPDSKVLGALKKIQDSPNNARDITKSPRKDKTTSAHDKSNWVSDVVNMLIPEDYSNREALKSEMVSVIREFYNNQVDNLWLDHSSR